MVFQGDLIVGGIFTTAGGVAAVGVARFNFAKGWSAIGATSSGVQHVYAMTASLIHFAPSHAATFAAITSPATVKVPATTSHCGNGPVPSGSHPIKALTVPRTPGTESPGCHSNAQSDARATGARLRNIKTAITTTMRPHDPGRCRQRGMRMSPLLRRKHSTSRGSLHQQEVQKTRPDRFARIGLIAVKFTPIRGSVRMAASRPHGRQSHGPCR